MYVNYQSAERSDFMSGMGIPDKKENRVSLSVLGRDKSRAKVRFYIEHHNPDTGVLFLEPNENLEVEINKICFINNTAYISGTYIRQPENKPFDCTKVAPIVSKRNKL